MCSKLGFLDPFFEVIDDFFFRLRVPYKVNTPVIQLGFQFKMQ